MKFIELIAQRGFTILFNIDHIQAVKEQEDGTAQIWLESENEVVNLKNTYQEVRRLLHIEAQNTATLCE